MKRIDCQIAAICFIFLLLAAPFSAAPEKDDFQPNQGELNYQQEFQNNPTPENFNQLPDPTAADLVRLGDGATTANFEYLTNNNPQQAASYLEQRYNNDFAQNFYDNQAHLGLNHALDEKYISGDGKKEVSTQNIEHNLPVAAAYFTQKFGKEVRLEAVPPDFFFDASKNSLILGQSAYPIESLSNIVGARVTRTEVILIPAEAEEIGEISTTGGRDGTISYKDGSLLFIDAQGTEQKYSITGSEATRFNFKTDGTLEVQGPVKGIIWTDSNNYVQFTNRVGALMIQPNGDITAENAEVLTREIYADGKFKKEDNLITAQDHGDRGKGNIDSDGRTVVVDKKSRVGVKTQGQSGENNVKIHLDELPQNSDAFKPAPQGLEEAKEIAQKVRPAQGDLGNNAEVWIKKDETGTSVVSKGKVEVSFYDVGPNGGISSSIGKQEPHFIGHNGRSELELQLGSKTQISLRGRSSYSDDQYSTAGGEKFGIQIVQDGASLKITRDAGSPTDIIHADCFDCEKGIHVIRIQKTFVTGEATDIPGIISEPQAHSIKIVLKVDDNGKLGYFPADGNGDTTLGILAKAQTERKTVALGRDIVVQFPCGEKDCYVQLKNERGLGTAQAFYEEYDGKTTRTVPIDTGYGTILGEEKVTVSEEEKEKIDTLLRLVKAKQYGAIAQAKLEIKDNSRLKAFIFDKTGLEIDHLNDPGYGRDIEGIARYHAQAQDGIIQLEGLGINLDQRGNPKSPEDAKKINAINRQSKEFDLYTKVQENIIRSNLANIQAASESCRGNAQCPSQAQIQTDFEKTKKQLINIVNQREAAYREAKQREFNYLKAHPPEGAQNAEAEAVLLGKDIKENQQDALRIESSLRGTKENPGAEARAAAAQQRYEQLLREHLQEVDQQRILKEQGIAVTEITESKELQDARLEDYQEHDLVNTLQKNLANAQNRETNARGELEYISSEFFDRDDVIANLYFAAGLHAEAAEFVADNPYLSDASKQELLQRFEGHSETQLLERSTFLAALGDDQSIAEAGAIQNSLQDQQPGIVATPQFQKAQDDLTKSIIVRGEEQQQALDEQIARHQKQTTERRKGIFSGEEDYRRPQDLVGTAFEIFSPPLQLLRSAGVIPEDVNTVDYVEHVAGRALEKGHQPTLDYLVPTLASSYATPVAPVLDLLAASGVIREDGVESLREYGAYSKEKTEQEDRTQESLIAQQEYAQQRNKVLQAYSERGLSASDALRDIETGNYNPRVLQYHPELEGKPVVFKREGLRVPEGNTVVLNELANGRLPEETAAGREGLAAQALQRAENEEAIQGGKAAFVENEYREVSAYSGTAAAAEANAKIEALDETTLGISERYHQTIVEPFSEGFLSIDNIVTAPFDVVEVVKIADIALNVYQAEKELATLGKIVAHGTEEAKLALRLARQELQVAETAGDIAKLERLRTQYRSAAEAAQTAEQEAKIVGKVADLANQVKVSSYRQTLAEEYKITEQQFLQAAADLEDAQYVGDVEKAEAAQEKFLDSRRKLSELADLDEAAKVADARPLAERALGALPVSDEVRDAERVFEEVQDAQKVEEQVLGEARVTPETQEKVRIANEELVSVRTEELMNLPAEESARQAQNDLTLEGLADSEYAAAVEQKAAAESKVVPIRQEEAIDTDVFDPCNVAAAAIYGLAIPCARDFEATRPGQATVATGVPEVAISRPKVDLPPRISGQDTWNYIVEVLEKHQGVRLEQSTLEELVRQAEAEGLLLGSGGEGVVIQIPESARVQLGLEKPSVIKIRNTDPGLEGLTNSFPEQARILNRLADRGAAPRIYQAEETFYIAEKLEGKTLSNTIAERLSPEEIKQLDRAATREERELVLLRAQRGGAFDDIRNAVDDLAQKLVAENVEIVDFHWNNIILTRNSEGTLEAKVLDAGFAVSGDPATIRQVYDDKVKDALTSGGFEITPAEIRQLKSERTEAGVSDQLLEEETDWLRTSEISPEKISEPGGVKCVVGTTASCGDIDQNLLRASEENNVPLESRPITPEVNARRTEQQLLFMGRSSAVIDNGELTVGGIEAVRGGRPVIVVDNNPFAGKSAKDLENVKKFKESTPWLEVIDHHGVYDDGVDKHAFDRVMEWLDSKDSAEREALLASIQKGDTIVLTNAQNLDPDGIWSFFALTNPGEAQKYRQLISESDFYTDFSFFGSDTFDAGFDVAKAGDDKKLGFIILEMINEQKLALGTPVDARKTDQIFHNILDELPDVLKNVDSPKNAERYNSYARRLQAVNEEAKKVTKTLRDYVDANPRLIDNPVVATFAAENPNAIAVIETPDFLDKSEIYDWLAESAGRYTTDAPIIVAYNEKTGKYLIAQRYGLPGQRTADVDLTSVIARLNEVEGRPIWYGRAAVAVDVGGSQLPRERVLEILAEEWGNVYTPRTTKVEEAADILVAETGPVNKNIINGCAIAGGAIHGLASCLTGTANDINNLREDYLKQGQTLEVIAQRHPDIPIQTAKITLSEKIGEGSLARVYRGSIEEVGDDLAFKAAKGSGTDGRIIDTIFDEAVKAPEICQYVSCPKYYGIYEVDGVPFLVQDRIEGIHLNKLTDEEVIRYLTPVKTEKLQNELANAGQAGWEAGDLQFMVLTKDQTLGVVAYKQGDLVVVDVERWRKVDGVADNILPFKRSVEDRIQEAQKYGCAIAGGAIVGLAPCASGLESIVLSELPYEVGDKDWNQIVHAANDYKNRDIPKSLIEEFEYNQYAIGGGSEGVVFDIPQSIQERYALPEASVIKLRKTEYPQLNSFRQQASILEDLAQEGVAPKVFVSADNYYIAEKINGEELKTALFAGGRNEEVRPKLEQLIEILIEKDYNILDLHGENIIITPEGELKIIDTGLTFKWEGHPDVLRQAYEDRIDDILAGSWEQLDSPERIEELKLLPQYKPRVAYAGEGVFKLGEKNYYKTAQGQWKEKRSFWFDQKVEDEDTINILEAESNFISSETVAATG